MTALDRGRGVSLVREGPHVAVLTLDHPPANALSAPVRAALHRAFDEIDQDTRIRAVVLTGIGHFSAGGHLGEERRAGEDGGSEEFLNAVLDVVDRVEQCRVPVVAAITGGAVGGGLELAAACDIRVAGANAFFVAAGVNVGLVMSVWRLPRLVGLGPATDMLLTGDRYDARTAHGIGLVSTVVAEADLRRAALERARRIASRSPLAVEATKAAVRQSQTLAPEEARRLTAGRFAVLARTRDHHESVRAVLTRTVPDFERR